MGKCEITVSLHPSVWKLFQISFCHPIMPKWFCKQLLLNMLTQQKLCCLVNGHSTQLQNNISNNVLSKQELPELVPNTLQVHNVKFFCLV